MKPKEVLLKHGRITEITRGRISRENHEFLADLASKGVQIEGYAVTTKTNVKVVERVKPTTDKVIEEYSLRFPLSTPAHAFLDGKKISVSMREACGNCRVSLVQCTCGAPEVVRPDGSGSMRVYIQGDE